MSLVKEKARTWISGIGRISGILARGLQCLKRNQTENGIRFPEDPIHRFIIHVQENPLVKSIQIWIRFHGIFKTGISKQIQVLNSSNLRLLFYVLISVPSS